MTSIGERIKAERERLGLTQPDFAGLAGAAKRSQIGWEQGRTAPDANVLAAWAAAGADVTYVTTGERAGAINGTWLGMCEAALGYAYTARRTSLPPSAVRLSALVKVYNDALGRIRPGIDEAEAVRTAAENYVNWIDDPADHGLLARALFRSTNPSGSQEAADISVAGDGNRVAGRDFHEGSGDKKK